MSIFKRIKELLSSKENNEAFDKRMRELYKDELNENENSHDWNSVYFNYADKKAIYLCNKCHHQYIINPLNMFDRDSHISLLNDTASKCVPKTTKDYEHFDIGGEG